ncbi:Serine/threonine protein kinase [Candidatus Magnetobacterium bavaricum]|uniref:Serine/threonine protein kinase n=1 Tax=Candidatus Magnetobacterium bavaricum TaxID=29290 RepID=A0A0F3GKK5_9BACT|nr:Serine/threonine protein kinase [Candidatus Magnetobacterium bavaricum]
MGIFGKLFSKQAKVSDDSDKPSTGGVSNDSLPKGRQYKIGDRIAGRYQIYQILGGEGKSGFGIVYVCYDHEAKEVLALKTFQDKYLSSREARENFKKEALLWVHIERYPYIVANSWVQELDYRLYVGCEFVAPDQEGRNTLTQYLNCPVSFKQALTWSIQFCYAMEYAVSKGVTPHRDIKPDNIMITSDKTLKVTDFGLAGLLQGVYFTKDFHAKEEVRGGTVLYMAPEQFDGKADVRSDIYSFGIVMYQMVNGGRLPFVLPMQIGLSTQIIYSYWKEFHETYKVRGINSELFPIISKCLEKSPNSRYRRFNELRIEIESLYRKYIGESIPQPPQSKELEAGEFSNKGLSLANLGLIDEAIGEYLKAIKINPEYVIAHSNLGYALEAKGLIDEAIVEYCKAIKINPKFAEAHFNLGNALQDKGLIDEAIKEYLKAIKINPELAYYYNNLGIALKDKGLIDEAIKEYLKAIKINPEFAEAYTNLGNVLQTKGLIDEAIVEFENFIKYAPPKYAGHVEKVRAHISELKRRR